MKLRNLVKDNQIYRITSNLLGKMNLKIQVSHLMSKQYDHHQKMISTVYKFWLLRAQCHSSYPRIFQE